jgi:hypothetical protein
MKSSKFALVVALVMTVLNGGRCMVMLFFSARSLSYDTNLALPETGGTQANPLDQMQAGLQKHIFHHDQMALYGWIVALTWNLVLAGLLFFAIRRLRISN